MLAEGRLRSRRRHGASRRSGDRSPIVAAPGWSRSTVAVHRAGRGIARRAGRIGRPCGPSSSACCCSPPRRQARTLPSGCIDPAHLRVHLHTRDPHAAKSHRGLPADGRFRLAASRGEGGSGQALGRRAGLSTAANAGTAGSARRARLRRRRPRRTPDRPAPRLRRRDLGLSHAVLILRISVGV
jgi:hypothetical protein